MATRTQGREKMTYMFVFSSLEEERHDIECDVVLFRSHANLMKLTQFSELAVISQCAPVHPSGQKHVYGREPSTSFRQMPPFLQGFPSKTASSQADTEVSHFLPEKPLVQLQVKSVLPDL